ncbi:MAG: hypothetical protein WCH43_07935 [Verrucomicrobiota bacterium]
MSFFFNKPKEKGRTEPEKNQGTAGSDATESVLQESLLKSSDTTLLRFVRTTIESKSETTWYSHNSPVPKSEPMEKALFSKPVTVEIGAFLQRIPAEWLSEGPHDPKRQVQFNLLELVTHLGQRKPSVLLSSIAKACPGLFVSEITPGQDAEIYFPWHCVLEQLAACCNHAGIKWQTSAAKDASFIHVEQPPAPGAGIQPVEEGAVQEEPTKQPESPVVGMQAVEVDLTVREPSIEPVSVAPDPAESLIKERDLAIRERDEALAEVDRLKEALRHASEALEAVCKTGLKDKGAD